MGTRISRRGTTVLVLTSDAGLIRLARSILEPACMVIGRALPGANEGDIAEQTDVVIVDVESADHNVISTARRFCTDAQVIALCRDFREADCVAILDADVDYLLRPFRRGDLAARVRVAELRRFYATGRPRTYRNGLLVFDLFHRELAFNGRPIALSPSERAILFLLASQPGRATEYKPLLHTLGLDVSDRSRATLRSHILRLRRKIERNSSRPEIVIAEVGVGYRLAVSGKGPLHSGHESLPVDEEQSESP
jgi:two-component system KDP operon response regulator KdpE